MSTAPCDGCLACACNGIVASAPALNRTAVTALPVISGVLSFNYTPAVGGIKRWMPRSIRLSVRLCIPAGLGAARLGQLGHSCLAGHQSCADCGSIRTRTIAAIVGGISSRRPRGDNLFTIALPADLQRRVISVGSTLGPQIVASPQI